MKPVKQAAFFGYRLSSLMNDVNQKIRVRETFRTGAGPHRKSFSIRAPTDVVTDAFRTLHYACNENGSRFRITSVQRRGRSTTLQIEVLRENQLAESAVALLRSRISPEAYEIRVLSGGVEPQNKGSKTVTLAFRRLQREPTTSLATNLLNAAATRALSERGLKFSPLRIAALTRVGQPTGEQAALIDVSLDGESWFGRGVFNRALLTKQLNAPHSK